MKVSYTDTGLEMPSLDLFQNAVAASLLMVKHFVGQFFITDFFCMFKSDSRVHTLGLPLPSHQAG